MLNILVITMEKFKNGNKNMIISDEYWLWIKICLTLLWVKSVDMNIFMNDK